MALHRKILGVLPCTGRQVGGEARSRKPWVRNWPDNLFRVLKFVPNLVTHSQHQHDTTTAAQCSACKCNAAQTLRGFFSRQVICSLQLEFASIFPKTLDGPGIRVKIRISAIITNVQQKMAFFLKSSVIINFLLKYISVI
jgi:hypothetical protein